MKNPFRYFNSSPEVIRLAVMMYVKFNVTRPSPHGVNWRPESGVVWHF